MQYPPINVDARNSINQILIVVRDAIICVNGSTQISENWNVLVIAVSSERRSPKQTYLPQYTFIDLKDW